MQIILLNYKTEDSFIGILKTETHFSLEKSYI